jgi:hypothetical protein
LGIDSLAVSGARDYRRGGVQAGCGWIKK